MVQVIPAFTSPLVRTMGEVSQAAQQQFGGPLQEALTRSMLARQQQGLAQNFRGSHPEIAQNPMLKNIMDMYETGMFAYGGEGTQAMLPLLMQMSQNQGIAGTGGGGGGGYPASPTGGGVAPAPTQTGGVPPSTGTGNLQGATGFSPQQSPYMATPPARGIRGRDEGLWNLYGAKYPELRSSYETAGAHLQGLNDQEYAATQEALDKRLNTIVGQVQAPAFQTAQPNDTQNLLKNFAKDKARFLLQSGVPDDQIRREVESDSLQKHKAIEEFQSKFKTKSGLTKSFDINAINDFHEIFPGGESLSPQAQEIARTIARANNYTPIDAELLFNPSAKDYISRVGELRGAKKIGEAWSKVPESDVRAFKAALDKKGMNEGVLQEAWREAVKLNPELKQRDDTSSLTLSRKNLLRRDDAISQWLNWAVELIQFHGGAGLSPVIYDQIMQNLGGRE